jgi:hypothetical protein
MTSVDTIIEKYPGLHSRTKKRRRSMTKLLLENEKGKKVDMEGELLKGMDKVSGRKTDYYILENKDLGRICVRHCQKESCIGIAMNGRLGDPEGKWCRDHKSPEDVFIVVKIHPRIQVCVETNYE